MFLLNSVHLQGIKLASSAEDLLDKLGTKIMVSPKTFLSFQVIDANPDIILNRLLSCQLLENKTIKWKEIHILPSEETGIMNICLSHDVLRFALTFSGNFATTYAGAES